MAGQAYAARSPRYWVWVVGALVLCAGGGFVWHLLAESAEATPIVTGARPVLPSERLARAATATRAVQQPPTTSDVVTDQAASGLVTDLQGRIAELETELTTERGRTEQYRQAFNQASRQLAASQQQASTYRTAIEDVLSTATTRPAAPKKIWVSHLGEPFIAPIGWDGFDVSGKFYNLEDTPQRGRAVVDLFVDGSRIGTEVVPMALEAKQILQYVAQFRPMRGQLRGGGTVTARTRWDPTPY